jgi:integrase
MARLEYISFTPHSVAVGANRELLVKAKVNEFIPNLPQLFWDDGTAWVEANLWALDRLSDDRIDYETVKRTMKHLRTYAEFLDVQKFDWRHFPIRKPDQPFRKFRKWLLEEVEESAIALSTASNCMAAVIQFYRYADANGLVGSQVPMWQDRIAVIPLYDSKGFRRTIVRLSSELGISKRQRVGTVLEDGLLPVRADHMTELLRYTAEHATEELHQMLSVGFFTGARIGTIVTLTIASLETALEDPHAPGIYRIAVGPGTKISTKFSVKGEVMFPSAVLKELKRYASSTRRLLREAKADKEDKKLLFLNKSGGAYTVEAVNRLVYEMRKNAVSSGLLFMSRFKFHQSRATFGTWLMQLLLDNGTKTDAIGIVRDALLHKHESTTWNYIKFIDNSRAKAHFASEFNEAFTGLSNRDWSVSNV